MFYISTVNSSGGKSSQVKFKSQVSMLHLTVLQHLQQTKPYPLDAWLFTAETSFKTYHILGTFQATDFSVVQLNNNNVKKVRISNCLYFIKNSLSAVFGGHSANWS